MNRAINKAEGELIIRMDAHTEYAPDYVRKCLEVLRESNAENVGGPVLTRAEGYLAQAIALSYHTRFACGGSKARDTKFQGFVDSVTYGCWRKSTFERVGLFDESFCRSQDDELNRRIVAAGGKIYQSPKIISWYWPRGTLSALFRQYFQYGFWKATVTRKHRRVASWRHLAPAASVLITFALLLGMTATYLKSSSRWESIFLFAEAILAGLYFTGSIIASFSVARRSGWRFLAALPIVFATYHISYGLGFLLGLIHNPFISARASSLRNILTAVTR